MPDSAFAAIYESPDRQRYEINVRTDANRRNFTAEHAKSAEIFSFLGVLSGLGGEKWIRPRKS